jgi:hypothetical protein
MTAIALLALWSMSPTVPADERRAVAVLRLDQLVALPPLERHQLVAWLIRRDESRTSGGQPAKKGTTPWLH